MQRCISKGKQGHGRCHSRHSRLSDPMDNHKKIIAPRRVALIVASSDHLKPDVPLPEIPTTFPYVGFWFPVAGVVYYFSGTITKGKSTAQIDRKLALA